MALKFDLARAREFLYCSSERLVLKVAVNSSLCNRNANAASWSWLGGNPVLVLKLISPPLLDIPEGLTICLLITWEFILWGSREPDSGLCNAGTLSVLLLEILEWLAILAGLWCSASLLFKNPAVFLASTSLGNSSWIVFQGTVFTVQHLPLLISCLHLGHFFPYLSAADHKHFLQKSIGPFTSKSTKAKQGESVVSGNSSGFDHHRVFIHSATARRAYPQEQNHIRSTEQGKSIWPTSETDGWRDLRPT